MQPSIQNYAWPDGTPFDAERCLFAPPPAEIGPVQIASRFCLKARSGPKHSLRSASRSATHSDTSALPASPVLNATATRAGSLVAKSLFFPMPSVCLSSGDPRSSSISGRILWIALSSVMKTTCPHRFRRITLFIYSRRRNPSGPIVSSKSQPVYWSAGAVFLSQFTARERSEFAPPGSASIRWNTIELTSNSFDAA